MYFAAFILGLGYNTAEHFSMAMVWALKGCALAYFVPLWFASRSVHELVTHLASSSPTSTLCNGQPLSHFDRSRYFTAELFIQSALGESITDTA